MLDTFKKVIAKTSFVALFFAVLTQIELGVVSQRENVPGMVDHLFILAQPWNDWLREQEAAAAGQSTIVTVLLGADTLFVSLVGLTATFVVLAGDNLVCPIAMLLNHSFRAMCMLLVELPKPEHIIWRKPGFPSEGDNDYFFSGHVALPIIAGIHLYRMGYPKLSILMHVLNIVQFAFMVIFQLHYTVDLVTGLMSGFCCYYLVEFGGDKVEYPFLCAFMICSYFLGAGELDFSQDHMHKIRVPLMSKRNAWLTSVCVVTGSTGALFYFDAF